MSSAKNLTEYSKLSGRSLMYIRKSNDPKIEPCGTPATIPDKIFGTKLSNPVKLDRKRKVWYLFLHVF